MTLLATLRVKETYFCNPREERMSAICVLVYVCVFLWLVCTFGKGEWAEQNLTLGLQTAIVNLDTTHSSFTAQIAWFIPGTARPLCACKTLQSAPSHSQTRKVLANSHLTHADSIYDKCSISVFVDLHELQKPACSKLNWCWTVNSGMLPLCWRHNSDSCFLWWQKC